ncbi:MAG: hypothetical protein R2685_03440 [Candidatus Nitrosocosmicus sp.]|nr:hypothetical protein [Candidatus Nitrosocosmicus sp.]
MSLLARMTLIYESKYFTIILIISISTLFHLYNVTGFPTIHIDEGTYMYRAMHFLTLGNVGWNVSFYDHPYFGPVLLGILLKVVNYPLLVLSDTQFQGLANNPYLIPRLMMGLFAIIDTFLVYAISKRLYDRNVAILSAVLFSVSLLPGYYDEFIWNRYCCLFFLDLFCLSCIQIIKISRTEKTHGY